MRGLKSWGMVVLNYGFGVAKTWTMKVRFGDLEASSSEMWPVEPPHCTDDSVSAVFLAGMFDLESNSHQQRSPSLKTPGQTSRNMLRGRHPMAHHELHRIPRTSSRANLSPCQIYQPRHPQQSLHPRHHFQRTGTKFSP